MDYTRMFGLPATAGLVGFFGSRLLYGSDVLLSSSYGDYDLGLVMGVASAVGILVSELTHDYIFKWIHVSERLSNPATIAVNTGINMASEVAIMSMLNQNSFAEMDKGKLAMESLGVVVLSDWIYSNLIGPLVGDSSKAIYA